LQADFPANHIPDPFNQFWRPCRRHSQTGRKDGRPDSHVTVRRFFGKKERDSKASVLYSIPLQKIT
jgi:hypothetical protein